MPLKTRPRPTIKSAPDLPLELCLLVFQFIPATTDRFRLACVSRSFAEAARLAPAWPDLSVRCVGVKFSRTGRKILPSEDSFLEDLRLFLPQRRFARVQTLDARDCHLGEPVPFIKLLINFMPALVVITVSNCSPEFHWAFLRWDRAPPAVNAALLAHPSLMFIHYGRIVWTRVGHRFVKI